ncbi:hypothetical protein GS597_19220 [Synechococcales cyanobacterium C]|uniref:Uncharacterized protein n=1 Tax=Petrachloros mirabilis ULC683 TaxID=2781853 RepID=A0A8K2A901_9CYAN|nr:hypothetical protein [Petrachloros mirabilis]NCJ08601.1 hypothetical protein [Petrachloros mirabilis ULC683]
MKFQFSRSFNFGVTLVSGIVFGNATIALALGTGSSLLNGGIIKPSNERLAPDERFKQNYLIAASPQLDNLLYNFSFKYSNTIRYYKVTSPDHYAAYTLAWLEFSNVAESSSIAPPVFTPTAGWIYTAKLKGGGNANLREYGSSPQTEPTIDLLNHYTRTLGGQVFSLVKEVKFPYKKPLFCPVSTTGC